MRPLGGAILHTETIAPIVATISVLLIPLLLLTFHRHIPSRKAGGLLAIGVLLGVWTAFTSLAFRNWLVEPLFGLQGASRQVSSGVVAPLVEETVKGLAAVGVLAWCTSKDFLDRSGVAYGLLFGATVGVGFAIVEGGVDALNRWMASPHDGLNRLMVRAVSGHIHVVASALFVGGASLSIWRADRWRWAGLGAIVAAYVVHLWNNLGVVSANSQGLANLAFASVIGVLVGTWTSRGFGQLAGRLTETE